jgi:hypothetical protein
MLIAGFHNVGFAGSVKRTAPRRVSQALTASAIGLDDPLTAVHLRLLLVAHLILSVSGPLLGSLALSEPPHTMDSRCNGDRSRSPRASEIPH